MQAIDDRESKIRESFKKLEDETGRISKKSIVSLITVMLCRVICARNLNDLLRPEAL